jgi:folate-dependent tRNA-U54 methylase TrmFO/GidA
MLQLEIQKFTINKRNYYQVQMVDSETYKTFGNGFCVTKKQMEKQYEQLKYFDELNLIPNMKNYIKTIKEIIKNGDD